MPRYSFDIHRNGEVMIDSECQELPDVEAVRKEAMAVLPEIALNALRVDGDRQNFVVVARDQSGVPVYTATLSYVGLKLE